MKFKDEQYVQGKGLVLYVSLDTEKEFEHLLHQKKLQLNGKNYFVLDLGYNLLLSAPPKVDLNRIELVVRRVD